MCRYYFFILTVFILYQICFFVELSEGLQEPYRALGAQ